MIIQRQQQNIFPDCFAILIAGMLLSSCGGSRTATTATNSKTGRATMTIKWPARNARVIPTAANCIVVTLTQGSKQVASSGPIARPTSGGTSTWTTPGLEPNTYTISARAFPNSDGSGTVQANGTGSIAITATSVAQASVTMGSTVTNVSLTSSTPACRPGAVVTVGAKVTDSTGAIVLVADSDITWKVSDTALLRLVTGGIQAQFQGLKTGSPTITCSFNGVDNSLGQLPISTPAVKCPITAPGPATSWPLSGGNEQGNATTMAPSLLSAQLAWTDTYGLYATALEGIAPDGSVLIEYQQTGGGDVISELNPDGSTKWTVPRKVFGQTLIASDGSIYCAENQQIVVLSGADGSQIATYPTPETNTPAFMLGSNGALYWTPVGSSALNAFNADGTTWSVSTGPVVCDPVMDPAGNIYVAVFEGYTQPGMLTSISPGGAINWTVSLGLPFSDGFGGGQLVYGPNGNVYVGTNTGLDENNNSVVAVSTSGKVLWKSPPIGLFTVDSKGNLYSGSDLPWSYTSVVKIDASNGSETTIVQFPDGTSSFVQSVSQGDILYVVKQDPNNGPNTLSAYDTSGHLIWSVTLSQGPNSEVPQFAQIAPDGSIYTMAVYQKLCKVTGSTSRSVARKR